MRLIKTTLLILAFVLVAFVANAQTRLTGQVIDSVTLKPLPGASVYIGNSTFGTKTNENGIYTFNDLAQGNYQILVTYVGYQTKQVELAIAKDDKTLNITLKNKAVELNEVTVHSANDWKDNLNLFKRDFIGTDNADECKILNPTILNLDYDYKNKRLNASTNDFLDIENSLLGYKLRFLVKDFWADYKTGKYHYLGTVIFEELHGTKSAEKRWIKNRLTTYQGSFRHFLTSLVVNQTDKDKFIIRQLIRPGITQKMADSLNKLKSKPLLTAQNRYSVRTTYTIVPQTLERLEKAPLQGTDIMYRLPQSGIYQLSFSGYLYIIYKGKRVGYDMDDLYRFQDAGDFQISSIRLKDSQKSILFNSKGLLMTKNDLFYEGAWNNRIINLLPDDYAPDLK